MIRLSVLVIALVTNAQAIDPPDPPPPGVGACSVRGDVRLPCEVADYYYLIADIIRNAPVRF